MKKIIFYIFVIIALINLSGLPEKTYAVDTIPLGVCKHGTADTNPIKDIKEADCKSKNSGNEKGWIWISYYYNLAPLPCEIGTPGCNENGVLEKFNPTENNNIGAYLNVMIRIFIGICAVLAVIMIVIGGLEYMTSELVSNKEHGKERISGAIFGLILALGAWTILNQINPNLLNTDLKSLITAEVVVQLGGEGTRPINESTIQSELKGVGITCPKEGGVNAISGIAQSYIGKSDYSRDKRNTTENGKAYIDCSAFATQVYICAGFKNPGGTSSGIFSSANAVKEISSDGSTVNGKALKVGDLIGWKQGENKEEWGHVMIYIGNGQMIDAQGGSGVGIRKVSDYSTRIKYVKPI